MSPPFRIVALDHVVLRAKDPERLERFYVEVLGCERIHYQKAIGLRHLRAGDALIDIIPQVPAGKGASPASGTSGTSGTSGNMDHLCLRVSPFDEARIRAHLAGYGVEVGALADRFGAEGRGPSLYLCDPEGNGVEIKGETV